MKLLQHDHQASVVLRGRRSSRRYCCNPRRTSQPPWRRHVIASVVMLFQALAVAYTPLACNQRRVHVPPAQADDKANYNGAHWYCSPDSHNHVDCSSINRRKWLMTWSVAAAVFCAPMPVSSAPPFAIIAEELGYYPVMTRPDGKGGATNIYMPKRISRTSSAQAVQLARQLSARNATVFSAYWCPHCARQKELFGREAWALLRNIECDPRGYQGRPDVCVAQHVQSFPTWIVDGQRYEGEQGLAQLAQVVGMKYNARVELNVPPPLGSTDAC